MKKVEDFYIHANLDTDVREIFMKVDKPYPLISKHNINPCFIRPIQDDSPMGVYNKEIFSENFLNNVFYFKGNQTFIPCAHGIATESISRFEVVAEWCPEGSLGWALYQIRNGKRVKDRFGDEWDGKIHRVLHKVAKCHEPFTVYENDTNDTCELIKGHWYRGTSYGLYYQYLSSRGDDNTWRYAGEDRKVVGDLLNVEYHGATLEPDFTDAKVGDKVFSSVYGTTTVEDVYANRDIYIEEHWAAIMNDGRRDDDEVHPSVFHSFEHFLAYHQENEYQRRIKNND